MSVGWIQSEELQGRIINVIQTLTLVQQIVFSETRNDPFFSLCTCPVVPGIGVFQNQIVLWSFWSMDFYFFFLPIVYICVFSKKLKIFEESRFKKTEKGKRK